MHRHNVFAAALSGDGSRIITGSVAGEVLVWSTRPFVPVRDLPPPANRGKISALALSPDGAEALVAPDWKPAVERWDVGAGAAAARGALAAHTGRTTALAYAPAGGIIATGGADRLQPAKGGGADDEVPKLSPPVVRLWKQGARVHELAGLQGRIGAIAFSPDGALVAAGGDDAVKVWRTADGAAVATYDLAGEAAAVAFRGEDVCAVSSKAAACFGKRGAAPIQGARAPTRAAAITPGWIASGTYEEVEVRDAAGAVRATIPGRAYAIVGRGDDLWAILADQVIPVRSGVAASPVMLKVPAK
jgi:WD40 repeat protein